VNPATQKDAAARVGVGVQVVNLAVRLLNSNNTPLIKRAETGDATRAEVDELLYDRAAAQAAETVPSVQRGHDEDDGEAPLGGTAPSNVVRLPAKGKAMPSTGSKPSHPERRAKETPVSRVVQHFKALSEKDRVQFCIMANSWLKPAWEAATKAFAAQGGKAAPKRKAA